MNTILKMQNGVIEISADTTMIKQPDLSFSLTVEQLIANELKPVNTEAPKEPESPEEEAPTVAKAVSSKNNK